MARAKKKANDGEGAAGTAPQRAPRRKQAVPGSRGLAAAELQSGVPPAAVDELAQAVAADGGAVLGTYRDPLGGHWQLLADLPVEKVVPTPFQRDLSDAHVKRLTAVVDKLDRFLDPVIAVRQDDGTYWTPNGHHRTAAVRKLGGRAIVALVLPDREDDRPPAGVERGRVVPAEPPCSRHPGSTRAVDVGYRTEVGTARWRRGDADAPDDDAAQSRHQLASDPRRR